jgi:hypothetical protein
MFDLRYHVASLAAVFLALVIGIVVGVGISDRGLVDSGKRSLLESEVARLQKQLDQASQQSNDRDREQRVAKTFVENTYPTLVRNRLRGKQVTVLYIGSGKGSSAIRSAVGSALSDAGVGTQQLRLRVLRVPIDVNQLDSALKGQPAAAGLRGRNEVDSLGRALGQELMAGGDTPLWNPITDGTSLVEERTGGNKAPADGVVIVRTVTPQHGPTSRFLLGLYSGLASAGVPAVGVEQTDAPESAVKVFGQSGLSTVDNLDTPVGKLALVLLLAGQPAGHYGVKDSASDGPLPPLPTPPSAGG